MEWTEEKCLELIAAYEKRPILWEAKHPQHFNKLKKQDAWDEIAAAVDFEVEACKKKMTVLLASLRRERSKIRKSSATAKRPDEMYCSSWFGFKHMQFLFDKDRPIEALNTAKLEHIEEGEREDPSTQKEVPSMRYSLNADNSKDSPKRSPCRKRKFRETHRLDGAYDALKECIEDSRSTTSDELVDFGQFVSKKLRKYDELTRTYIQYEFMAIFLNADRGHYSGTPYPVPLLSNQFDPMQSRNATFQDSHPPINHSLGNSTKMLVPSPSSAPYASTPASSSNNDPLSPASGAITPVPDHIEEEECLLKPLT